MASIDFVSDTGLTLVAKIHQPGGDQVGSDITLTEHGTHAGIYTGTIPGSLPAGLDYYVLVWNGALAISDPKTLYWDGANEILPIRPSIS